MNAEEIKLWVKDHGLVDTLLIGNRTKPIYLEALLKEFTADMLTMPAANNCSSNINKCSCERCGGFAVDDQYEERTDF